MALPSDHPKALSMNIKLALRILISWSPNSWPGSIKASEDSLNNHSERLSLPPKDPALKFIFYVALDNYFKQISPAQNIKS